MRYDFGYKSINKEKTVKGLTFEEFKKRKSDQISTIRTLLSVQCGNWEKEGQGTIVNSPLKAITVTWAGVRVCTKKGVGEIKGKKQRGNWLWYVCRWWQEQDLGMGNVKGERGARHEVEILKYRTEYMVVPVIPKG